MAETNSASHARSIATDSLIALTLALTSFALVVAEIDTGGDYRSSPQGPGVTLDESFNVEQGVYLYHALRELGVSLFTPSGAAAVFDARVYLADHPPLGRIWIGTAHAVTRWCVPPMDADRLYVISAARTAPASAFAVLVGLVTFTGIRWYGRRAGWLAGPALLLMPRVFGHAHLASLETFIGLTYTAAVVCLAFFWRCGRLPTARASVLCGIVFGLALLSKIQAGLLPIPIGIWALWHFRHRALVPLVVWGTAGLLVFITLWPWIWLDPVEHLREYLGRTTNRVPLKTWYLGHSRADVDVAWHYPFVMFAATMPLGTLIAALTGLLSECRSGRRQPRERLLLLCGAFPLVVFSLPGVAAYDGVRLFLVVYPLWALLATRGWVMLFERFRAPVATSIVLVCLAPPAWGILTTSPLPLSWYSATVGGLRGAEVAGLEATYWGDSLTRDFWQQVPQDATVHVAPVLSPRYLDVLAEQLPVIRERRIRLVPFEYDYERQPGLVLLFCRKADVAALLQPPKGATRITEIRRSGIQLAVLYDTSQREDQGTSGSAGE